MSARGLLAYWFDLAPECQAEWADWYIRDHMPSRLGATFTAARCLRSSSAEPQFMALYETPTPEQLIAPDYLALLRNASDGDRRRRRWYEHTVRGCCRVLADHGHGRGGVVCSIRYSPRVGAGAMADQVGAGLAADLAGLARIGRATHLVADAAIRAKMDEARVTGHDDRAADRLLLIECSSDADAERALQHLHSDVRWREHADGPSIAIGTYRLLYAIAR